MAIQRAIVACEQSGHDPMDHFCETTKMITAGKGARRSVRDYELSRYACYLVIQNADPTKEIIALGQTYFAVQTRRQELNDADAIGRLPEDQRRLFLHYADHNSKLAAAAQQAGIVEPRMGYSHAQGAQTGRGNTRSYGEPLE